MEPGQRSGRRIRIGRQGEEEPPTTARDPEATQKRGTIYGPNSLEGVVQEPTRVRCEFVGQVRWRLAILAARYCRIAVYMGLDVALEGENCQAEPSPKMAYTFLDCPKVGEKKGKTKDRYYELKILDGGFTELSAADSSSPCRRSMPSRPAVKENDVQKRGSMYHSSREIKKMTKRRQGKRNLETVDGKEDFLSFEIVNSLAKSQQDELVFTPQQKSSLPVSLNEEHASMSDISAQPVLTKHADIFDLSFRHMTEEQSDLNSSCSGSISMRSFSADGFQETCQQSKSTKFFRAQGSKKPPLHRVDEGSKDSLRLVLGPENDGNFCHENDTFYTFSKSVSAKIPCRIGEGYLKDSSKPRFNSLKKMLDPIMKSKSLRNPSAGETETLGFTVTDPANIQRSRELRKSLLNDFSSAAEKTKFYEPFFGGDPVLMAGSSPAHLQGTLRLEFKHGVPSFEFSVKDPELLLSAKVWKTEKAFNWIYTFHKKRSSGTAWGAKDRHGHSPSVIGQMHATCYLCSAMNDNGCVDNSMVTEFVLHDMVARSWSIEEKGHYSSDLVQAPNKNSNASYSGIRPLETNDSMEQGKCNHPLSDPVCSSYPWAPSDVHPQDEIAAVVIQIPFGKEGSKSLQVDEVCAKKCPNLSSPSKVNQGSYASNGPVNIKVVTPSGRHGLPNTNEGGPSSLLDRWRTGGGCDCGGWDMGCPIVIFDNSSGSKTNHSSHERQKLMMLFSRGRKDKIPSLTITAEGKGVYSVQFHAQLSALQAFSICIAMLHGSETSGDCEESRLRLYSNSLKLLLEEEVRNLIEAVAKEEKRKSKKRLEQIHPSSLLDPPFSPMGRV
ncbi:hypothetical protein J5N97_024086 [Dioscorea zingiberensis]|uniref:Uncharacterized protein n=1 Tax=Dioscorea zingiberensis TaxID=325984 RepID=A0A9D5C6T5_9LILI|nr:hypothetical protein J5N97_024086 [Dioscorea zingiberensis]